MTFKWFQLPVEFNVTPETISITMITTHVIGSLNHKLRYPNFTDLSSKYFIDSVQSNSTYVENYIASFVPSSQMNTQRMEKRFVEKKIGYHTIWMNLLMRMTLHSFIWRHLMWRQHDMIKCLWIGTHVTKNAFSNQPQVAHHWMFTL